MSTEEKNKALVCRFLEAQSKGDLEALDELLAPDFVDHGLLPGHDPGREGFVQGVAEAHAALSFIRTTIEYQGTDGDDMVITLLLRRGGLGAGGRHHPPYATTFGGWRLTSREPLLHLRGWMNNLHARWSWLPRSAPTRGERLTAPSDRAGLSRTSAPPPCRLPCG
jgi:SnoaL-like domain